jgi:hypothetical protein
VTAGDWRSLAALQFRRLHADLTALLTGASDDWLHTPVPGPAGANAPAWLAWHVARGQDRNVSELLGRAQLWTAGWADRFGRPRDPADTGLGHTRAQAAALRVPPPSAGTLTGYVAAAHALALEYLATAPAGDAKRSLTSPTLRDTHTVEERLAALLRDGFEHVGRLSTAPPAGPWHG